MSQSDLPVTSDVERIRLQHGALLNEREAADLLGVNVRSLQTWRRSGIGPEYIKLGDAHNAPVRYPAAKLRAFLDRYTVRTAPMLTRDLEAPRPGTPAAARPSRPAPAPPKDAPAAPGPGLSSLRTVRDLAEELKPCGITEGSIRWHLFNADSNGLNASGAVVRPPNSRRLFIDRDKFERWMRSRSERPADPPAAPRGAARRSGR